MEIFNGSPALMNAMSGGDSVNLNVRTDMLSKESLIRYNDQESLMRKSMLEVDVAARELEKMAMEGLISRPYRVYAIHEPRYLINPSYYMQLATVGHGYIEPHHYGLDKQQIESAYTLHRILTSGEINTCDGGEYEELTEYSDNYSDIGMRKFSKKEQASCLQTYSLIEHMRELGLTLDDVLEDEYLDS